MHNFLFNAQPRICNYFSPVSSFSNNSQYLPCRVQIHNPVGHYLTTTLPPSSRHIAAQSGLAYPNLAPTRTGLANQQPSPAHWRRRARQRHHHCEGHGFLACIGAVALEKHFVLFLAFSERHEFIKTQNK